MNTIVGMTLVVVIKVTKSLYLNSLKKLLLAQRIFLAPTQ